MATQAYRTWNSRGRPWQNAVPVAELKTLVRRYSVPFLGDLGNEEHLQSSNPQDHTPFSFTARPIALPGYVVCAIDMGIGPWFERMVADARAGRLPWLKYINGRGRQYSDRDGFAVGRSNPDHHCHVSVKSDWCFRSIDGYDPFVPAAPAPPPAPPAPQPQEDEVQFLAQHKANGQLNPAVFYGDGERFRRIRHQGTVTRMLRAGANGDSLSTVYKPGGVPFESAEEMHDTIGRVEMDGEPEDTPPVR